MTRAVVVLVLLIVSLGSTGGAAAETLDEETNVYTLGEVVVLGTRPGVEAVATKWEITADDIEEKNARTLDEALKITPGVIQRTGAQGIPRINMRGLRSRHVILLLNGIPINSPADGQFNPAIISTDNIAKIKVSYGGSSVLYGQGGLGGVINVITKKGKEGFGGSVTGEIAERGQWTGRFNLSGGNEKLDVFVSGSIEDSDGYRLSQDFTPTELEDGGLRDNSHYERNNIFFNAGYAANDDWKLGITLESQGGDYGSPPSALKRSNSDPFAKNPKYVRIEDYDGKSAQFSAAYNPDNPFELRAWVFYNEYEEESAGYDDADYSEITAKNGYFTDDETKVTGGHIQGIYDFGTSGRLTASLAAEQDEFHTVGEIILKKKGPLVPYDNQYEVDIHSLALEYDVFLFSSLDLVLGYSHHWQKRDMGDDDDKGSALLGARYEISDHTKVRASVSRKIRFPSITQLYDENNGGNMALTTEQSTNYELGFTWQMPWNIEADLAGFINDVEDYIKRDADDVNQNNDEYRFKGFEIALRKPFLETGSAKLGYSYMDAEDKSVGALTDVLEYNPKHKFTFECGYAWSFGLSGFASFIHVADQYHLDNTGTEFKKLGDYSLVDVKLQQKIFKDRIYAYIGCNNLFDEDYEESYGFPQAGRMAYIGMKFTF